ncbi:MAG TPA: hypothetical protein VD886_26375 [Herpetosiphonaceae bacterium]|nr:hypothetical protein [Herpetosiphonaceae bacterium]
MAVTSRNLRTNKPERWSGQRVVRVARPGVAQRQRSVAAQPVSTRSVWLNYILTGVVVVLLSLLVGTLNGWVGTKIDDIRYGRPRVSHLSAKVGHEGEQGLPTEFVAINLNRRVVVLEFPGGDANAARTIVGPYLFGAGEDLTPITLDTLDVNADAQPDLLVTIKNEQLVYINQPDGFRMITAAEQGSLNHSTP